MADKDINIHIRAKNAEETQRKFDDVSKSAKDFGRDVDHAGKQAAESTDKAGQKIGGLKGIIAGATAAIGAFYAAMKAGQWILGFLDKMAEKYARIRDLQKQVHDNARTLQEAGQSLEIQTGTVGQQAAWAEYLTKLRTAGALKSVGESETAAISFDIATGGSGGLGSAANKELLMQLAPMFGMSQLSGDEIKKFLDLSSTAGVAQTAGGYQQFFAELFAGFRSSKSSNFGQFLTGLQSGTTGLLAQGGSSQGAVSLFASAPSVMKNEEVAATLAQQIGTLSSGAYEKPRQALEAFGGVSWENLSPDEQVNMLLAYTQNIPANQRVQQLTAAGFSPELATGLAKMSSPEAQRVMASTRQAVGGADVGLLQRQIGAYQQSLPGMANIRGGRREGGVLEIDKQIGAFQERLADARLKVDMLAAQGKDDIWMDDEYEAYYMAYLQMEQELLDLMRPLRKMDTPEAKALLSKGAHLRMDLIESGGKLLPLPGMGGTAVMKHRYETGARRGVEYEERLEELQQGTTIINYNNNKVIMTKEPPASTRPGDL